MPMTPGDSGGGSSAPPSTNNGVCSISPSDLVGYTGDALNRIKDLEQRVAELEAKIVQANQLSDLSQQVGWVGGIEYMGVSGWTQTEYGTLIPPPGMTLSSLGITIPNVGTPQQLVIMDTSGNLVLGAGTDGIITGSFASGSGITAYADVGWRNNVFSSAILSGITVNSTSRSAGAGTISIGNMATGLYYATGYVTQYVLDGDGTAGAIINGFLQLGVVAYKDAVADTSGVLDSLGGGRESAAIGTMFSISSTSTNIVLDWTANVEDGSATFQSPYEFGLVVIGL